MPGLSGIDVLASIRAIDADVKVIMLTGVTRQNVANQAFDQGVFDYIGKPVDPAYLELSVATALSDPDTWAPEGSPPGRS
jgi:DNA-binding NtrC family response regulator